MLTMTSTDTKITVVIVDDDRITRDSLADVVRRAGELELLAAFADGETALREIGARIPDVVVMDVNLSPVNSGRLNGADCVAALKAAHPQIEVLMLTVYDDDDRIFESLRAGATGYILKRTRQADIVAAIREVHEGGAPMSMKIARRVVQSFAQVRAASVDPMASLTAREREILAMLSEGALYKEIARKLGLSTNTVRVHLHAIYGKLHVQTRTQAVLKYLGR